VAIPHNPEALENPKREMVKLARSSRKKEIREDMAPHFDDKEGPAYASRLAEFAQTMWRPEVAAGVSDSLRRCLDSLKQLVAESSSDDAQGEQNP
jgi:hypothetical protein